jgi:hypothetical protein
VNSFILKFLRDAESDAKALGSHLMGSGVRPGGRWLNSSKHWPRDRSFPQFLSDHPNPGNREKAIRAEMQTLPSRNYGCRAVGALPFQIELSQALPAPVLTRDGPGYRFMKEMAIQVACPGKQPLKYRHLQDYACLGQSRFGYIHRFTRAVNMPGRPRR